MPLLTDGSTRAFDPKMALTRAHSNHKAFSCGLMELRFASSKLARGPRNLLPWSSTGNSTSLMISSVTCFLLGINFPTNSNSPHRHNLRILKQACALHHTLKKLISSIPHHWVSRPFHLADRIKFIFNNEATNTIQPSLRRNKTTRSET